jgi:hypothetical protein
MPASDDASPPDHYARLGVRPSASAEEIRQAYRQKAQETHPDRNPDDPRAAERFRKVKEAYQVLRDPERRAQYDDVRAAKHRTPDGLTITQQAPAGCGGYLWRVLAGMVAVALFFVLEMAGVWSAGMWTITGAVGLASLVAALIAIGVARQFPDEATDVSMRLTDDGATMWADGHVALQLNWRRVQAVRLHDDGWTMELIVERSVAEGLRPVPPVLVTVDRRSDRARLELDLSDTDVPRDVLVSFLRTTPGVPFPAPTSAAPPSAAPQ